LKVLVQKITDLPTLPAMMATITRLMQDPRTSAEELGRAIASDPALVSKVLKLVNSAFYGFPGRISTITQAIVILGFSTIRNVVLTTSVLKAFGKSSGPGAIDVGKFWEHSLLTGAIARSLAVEREANFIEETAEFEKVRIVKEKAGLSQLAAEQSVLKLTHGDIGGWLARKWNLPLPYVEVMRLHHFPAEIVKNDPPSQSDTTNLICIVHAADALSKGLKDGKPDLASLEYIDPAVRTELKLGEGWERFQARTEEEIAKARSFLEIL
jgi:HD-like signal output (HDOD) protein